MYQFTLKPMGLSPKWPWPSSVVEKFSKFENYVLSNNYEDLAAIAKS